ncbi:hypothetical protein L6452_18199 [Arctium lappa]|uniref:Uncharacterized protein n=1 Tax=Arctium lappa TaxID=4217 RepID=A0ACB9C5N5_ARCLA|nr:hypothetical protein L6452_18199 [Arctium lappa]
MEEIRDDYDSLSSSTSSTLPSSDSLMMRKLKNRHHHNHNFEPLEKIKEEVEDDKTSEGFYGRDNNRKLESSINKKNSKRFGFSIRIGRSVECEQVVVIAKEAIDGWLPLKSDNLKVKPLKLH